MANGEISFDFKLTKENEEILKELLNAKGLIHYMVETKEKDKLDLVEYKEYQELEQELQKYKEVINRAVKFIEDNYYSLNTTDINSIAMTSNKLLQVRNILKGVEE